MRKLYFIPLLIFFISLQAQYKHNAPWNQEKAINNKTSLKFQDNVTIFEEYWKNKDFEAKGSGYKPFKRWENFYQKQLNTDGTIMRPEQLWAAWEQKKQSKSTNRSALSLTVSNWTAVGPFTHTNTGSWSSGQGRVQVVCVDPSNSSTIYIGSPAGGIWKSTNAGTNWTPLSDNLPQIGVSGIVVDHANSNVIYIATGDKDSSDTYSIGVLKSIDGGITWNTTGLSFSDTNSLAGDIVMHPTNNQILLCATSNGLYKTEDAGLTWTITNSEDCAQGSLRFKPNNPNVVYLTSYNSFFKSTDTGSSFTNITTGLPTFSTRLILDVSNANANYVYVLSADTPNTTATPPYYGFQGLFLSEDSGITFTKTAQSTDIFESGQAYYDLGLAVSQTDANTVFTGCLNIWKSTNKGDNFSKVNSWSNPTGSSYTHADIHYIKSFGGKTFVCSDGGIYISENEGTTFTDKTAGLQISQFYKVAVSKQTASKMVGGLQDNGGHAYSDGNWKNYYGADGMDTAIDPLNSDKYYGFIQSGGGLYISENAGNSRSNSVSKPSGQTGKWVTPLAINSQGELFAAYNKLYRLDCTSWVQQQNSLTNLGSTSIELITIDPTNDNIMYVANNTELFKSTNKGVSFVNMYSSNSNITSIAVNSFNNNIVYITNAGISGQALKSTDGGDNFTSFSQGLPTIAKNVIKHQGRSTINRLYLGTTLGVYYRDDSMSQWEPFDINLPNVSVEDLEINLEESILVAATYGRGIWQTNIPTQVATNDVKIVQIVNPAQSLKCNGTVNPVVSVQNNGTNTINTVNLNYTINGSTQNFTWSGTLLSGNSQNITIPAISLPKGNYAFRCTASINNDEYSDNNIGITNYIVNNSGTIGTLNQFETASTALLTDSPISPTCATGVSVWKRGINANGALATPGNNVYTTNFTGLYTNNAKAFLYSQCYDLSAVTNPVIKFKLAFDLELNYDLVYVEYSTNSGQSWQVLGTQGPNWYNSSRTPETTGSDCDDCVGAQWLGTNTNLTEYFYPLNSLNNPAEVIFRIVFQSDGSETKLGVTVDDFVIEGALANEEFSLKSVAIYPNPSSGIFNIATADKKIDTIEIFDISGKTIQTFNNFKEISNHEINLSNIANGIYFIKIYSDNQSITKKIIKN